MKKVSVERARARLSVAKSAIEKLKKQPLDIPDFEKIWYEFLTNFNNAFSQLEQAAKTSAESQKWYSGVKEIRKSNQLLCYLQHARNYEEHSGLSSVFRRGWLAKPLTRNVKTHYRDAKSVGAHLLPEHLNDDGSLSLSGFLDISCACLEQIIVEAEARSQ